ncbi:P68 family surface lipoprotein [Metamycoplasma alkalescens]|uniref:MG185/MG260 protein n=6 Tax=Metamycoplasma alkalescens TaxID=45363 RepID=A0A318U504_9BACT|nr:P80 family lipoprotein [Metamycoplasma alkalescens]PYF43131.1 MG185/MG260 protein [Metamycoplasma alkalescens]
MKKSNKILISMASVAALCALPLVAARCGGSQKFDQKNDGILKLATGLSETNNQGVAIKGVVEEYNKWLNSGSDEEKKGRTAKGYLPVELVFLPNGYNTGPLSNKLSSKDQNTFWNILLNYPQAASILAQSEMNLALSDEEFDNLNLASVFKNTNKPIAGNKNHEKWVVPFGVSSEMQSVNKLVLGKLLNDLKSEVDLTIEEKNVKKVNEYIDYYSKSPKKNHIDTEWNKDKASDTEKVKKDILSMNIKLADDIFESYEKLIKFSIAAKKLFPKNVNRPILGIDSLATSINVMNASQSKGDLNKGYITPSDKHEVTGGYDYESFLEKNTPQNKVFEDLLKLVFEGIKEGAIWVGGGGAYGSNILTKHNMALNIGSTAGWHNTFIEETSSKIYFVDKKENEIDKNRYFNLHKPDSNGDVISKFKRFEDGDDKINKIYSHDSKSKIGRYDKKFKSKNEQDKFLNELKNNFNAKLLEYEYDENNNSLILGRDSKGTVVNSFKLDDKHKGKFKLLGKIFDDDKNYSLVLDENSISNETISGDGLLNKNDADWINYPLVNKDGDKKSIFAQGPSMVLIHANEPENKGTKLFVNWMFTHNIPEITLRRKKYSQTYKNIKPIDAFNRFGNYISPTNSYFADDKKEETIKVLNEATKLAFESFNLAIKDADNYQLAEDVSSVLSDKLRDSISTAGRKMVAQYTSNTAITFEDFMKQISNLFK